MIFGNDVSDEDATITIPPGLFMEIDPELERRLEERKAEMGRKWVAANGSEFKYTPVHGVPV